MDPASHWAGALTQHEFVVWPEAMREKAWASWWSQATPPSESSPTNTNSKPAAAGGQGRTPDVHAARGLVVAIEEQHAAQAHLPPPQQQQQLDVVRHLLALHEQQALSKEEFLTALKWTVAPRAVLRAAIVAYANKSGNGELQQGLAELQAKRTVAADSKGHGDGAQHYDDTSSEASSSTDFASRAASEDGRETGSTPTHELLARDAAGLEKPQGAKIDSAPPPASKDTPTRRKRGLQEVFDGPRTDAAADAFHSLSL